MTFYTGDIFTLTMQGPESLMSCDYSRLNWGVEGCSVVHHFSCLIGKLAKDCKAFKRFHLGKITGETEVSLLQKIIR